jgi:hypothetical protein
MIEKTELSNSKGLLEAQALEQDSEIETLNLTVHTIESRLNEQK